METGEAFVATAHLISTAVVCVLCWLMITI